MSNELYPSDDLYPSSDLYPGEQEESEIGSGDTPSGGGGGTSGSEESGSGDTPAGGGEGTSGQEESESGSGGTPSGSGGGTSGSDMRNDGYTRPGVPTDASGYTIPPDMSGNLSHTVTVDRNTCPLLVLNNHDYTPCIKAPSWKVNQSPVYEEWTDANHVTHHDVLRRKTKGSFTLFFTDSVGYYQFLEDIQTQTTIGDYVILTVYANNVSSLVTGNFYVTMEIKDQLPFIGTSKYEGIEITIEER